MNRQARIERDRHNRQQFIDRARDALNNATPGPWESDGTCVHDGDNDLLEDVGSPLYASKPNLKLAALAPELAAEMVRLHDQLAELADRQEEIGRSALSGNLTDQAYGSGVLHIIMFLRKILEGEANE